MEQELRVIVSGGGTGGHIFPAVSIANAIKSKCPNAKILFVGALGRMEMQRVPDAGYEIVGLPVRGFIRPLWSPRNIGVALDFLRSKRMVRKTIREFAPDVVVGVGGYASAATLDAASSMGIPTLIQEQNSYAGVTNKHLAAKARKICVAYDGMERFFPAEKIINTGNPVRQNLIETTISREDALRSFGLDPAKKTNLLLGGKYYSAAVAEQLKAHKPLPMLKVMDFIGDMGAAYKAADLVISRAGASSVSEFCLIGKPVILVPSPNVAEDHQTKNALALVNKDAALYVKDADAPATLLQLAVDTVNDPEQLAQLTANIKKLGKHNSADVIADEVLKLANKK